jgi:hypothetical protein
MADRDFPPGLGGVGQVLADRVVDGELAVPGEEHDAAGDELLAHRRELEHRVGRSRRVKLEVRPAVGADGDGLAVPQHGEGNARDVPAVHVGADEVVEGVRPRGRSKDEDEEREQAAHAVSPGRWGRETAYPADGGTARCCNPVTP